MRTFFSDNSALDKDLTEVNDSEKWPLPKLSSTDRDRKELLAGWTLFYGVFKNKLFLRHCVPLYVCSLCIKYQDLSTNLLGVAALRILLLTFISPFVIDFLSI